MAGYYSIPGYTDLGDQVSSRNMALKGGLPGGPSGRYTVNYDHSIRSFQAVHDITDYQDVDLTGHRDSSLGVALALTGIQNAADTGQYGGILTIPAQSTINLGSTISGTNVNRVHIRGSGASSRLRPTGVDSSGVATSPFSFDGVDELVIEDLYFDGSQIAAPRMASTYGSNPAGQKKLILNPGFSIQAGDDVYIEDPEFLAGVFEVNTVASVDSAIQVTLVNNLANTYGDRRLVSTVSGGKGGYGLRIYNATKVIFRNVTFKNILRHPIDLHNVGQLLVDGCTFDSFGSAQVDSCYFAARAFGIGGYDCSRGRVVNSQFVNSLGRRSAGIELRSSVTSQQVAQPDDMVDWVFEGNHFIQIGGQSNVSTSHGAGINLVTGRNPVQIRRVALLGNTSYSIGDGHFWIATPGGEVTAIGNTMEYSVAGPFLNVNAPFASLQGNVMRDGGYAGIYVDAVATGDYSGGYTGTNTPGYLNLRGIEIIGNDISNLQRGGAGVGIVVSFGTTPAPSAHSTRQVIIQGNRVNGVLQAGIQLVNPRGDIDIKGNTVLDANVGVLATTTLTADTVSVAGLAYQQVRVASSAHFTPNQFVQMGYPTTRATTTLNGAVAAGATSFVVASATGMAIGHALWLGTEEANTAEIVVPTNIVGTTITCAPLALGHSSGVNVSSTYKPMVVSVDDAAHITLQYNQGVWASGTALAAPFFGSGGIQIQGVVPTQVSNTNRVTSAPFAKAAAIAATTITLDGNLTHLGWQSGDTVNIPGESAMTISGAPVDIDGSMFTVTLSAGLAAAHTVGYPASNIQVRGNRVGQDTLYTTQYGLFLGSGVCGPVEVTDNIWGDCTLGDVRDVSTSATLIRTAQRADWASDESVKGRLRAYDWAYVRSRAFATTLSAGCSIGDAQFVVADDGSLTGLRGIQVGDTVWLGAANAVGSELVHVSAVGGLIVTTDTSTGLKFNHLINAAVSVAATPGRISLYGASWDGTNYGALEAYYDPQARAYRIGTKRSSANVPDADFQIRNDMGGAIRFLPGGGASGVGLSAWQMNTSGVFLPNADVTYDVGSSTNHVRAVYTGSIRGVTSSKSADFLVNANLDSGKTFLITGVDKVATLPATVDGMTVRFIVTAAALSGGTGFSIHPDAADKIMGNGLAKVDGANLVNTGATDREGDYVQMVGDGADGWYITDIVGTWA